MPQTGRSAPTEEDIVTLRRAAFMLGRTIFGGYFAYSGISHFQQRQMMSGYAASKGIPAPDVAVQATGAMLVAGGASIMTGVQPRWGLAAVVGFLAGVTPTMHRFWDIDDPQQRMGELINFTKNLALAGACLMMMEIPEPWNADVQEEEWDLEVELDDETTPDPTKKLLAAKR
jgi:uncharacterized membrane protein YphA (DoxX/SURF4 family)